MIQHRKVKTVNVWNVAQLLACDISRAACALNLNDIRSEPSEQLRARGPRLHMGEI